MKFHRAIDLYLSDLAEKRRSAYTQKTINSRMSDFKSFLESDDGWELVDITSDHIHDYFEYMKKVRGLADGTLAGRKSTLRSFFTFAMKNGWVSFEDNPTHVLVDNHQHRYSYEPVNRLDVPENDLVQVLQQIPNYLTHHDYSERALRDSLIVALTADSAARRQAIWSIRKKDIKAALSKGRKNKHGQLVYHVSSIEGKTGSELIRFYEDTASLVHLYLEMQHKSAVWLLENPQTRKRYRIDGLHRSFVRLCKFAKVPVFRFHSVRKRDVIDAIESGGDQKLGQIYAGHRSQTSTQNAYNLLRRSRVDDVAGQLAMKRRGASGASDLVNDFFKKLS